MSDSTASKLRLLFLTVNSSFSHSSLALPLLHSACSVLTQWEWSRCDTTIAQDTLRTVGEICASQPDLLVTDLYLFNRRKAMEILERVHIIAPGIRIAAGGPECLGEGAEELLREYPWLECVFRGEGEEIFKEYLENFTSGTPLTSRILPAKGNGISALWDNSPYPVNDPFFTADKPFVQMETSRGCPMGCFYCTSSGVLPRYRSLEQVREELILLEGKGVKEIRLLDRTFNVPQERGAALLRLFREEFPAVKFHLELHPQFLNASLRKELQKARPGQLHIEAGIQCLDQEVQNLSGRRSNVKALEEGMAFLCGISAFETHADLIAGLPGQKWSHILKDTATLMTLGTAEIQLEVLKVLPGTPMRKIASAHDLRYSVTAPYDVMMSDTMTLEEIQYARDLSHLLDMTYNHKNLHRAIAVMNGERPDFVPCFLDFFHRSGGDSTTIWDLKKRFLFLLDLCRELKLAEGQRELAFQWLCAGFPTAQGPDSYSRKCGQPEKGFRVISGSAACIGAPETRYWHFPMRNREYVFAWNRSFALHLPAAILLCQES